MSAASPRPYQSRQRKQSGQENKDNKGTSRRESKVLLGENNAGKEECKGKKCPNRVRSGGSGNVTNLNVQMQVYINNIEMK